MAHEWKFPPCFKTRADYELWLDNPYQENLGAQHCTDCLPSFKMRMAKAGRCEHPETIFRFQNETGFDPGDEGVAISGSWSREPQPKIVRVVKVHKPKPRREVPADKRQDREKDVRDWWAARHQALMEKMNR